MRKALIILAVVLGAILSSPITASATAPTSVSFHDEASGLPVQDCGAFEVLLTFSHDESITTFYDKSGSASREQIRFNFTATLANSVSGKSAYEKGAYTIITDLASESTKVVGLVLLMHVRRVGVVTLELGQVTFNGATVTVARVPRILDGQASVCTILS